MKKVFGIGLSRTGTTTLSEVLKPELNIVHYPSKVEIYSDSNNGACDIPVIPEYKKLFTYFDQSKFVYTVRDLDEWSSSIERYFERKRKWNMSLTQMSVREQIYASHFPNKQQAIDAYKKHDDDVRNFFEGNEHRLLILDIVGGDKPKKLFDFLGLKNPAEEFPVTNQIKK